jgi:hypothetical protein
VAIAERVVRLEPDAVAAAEAPAVADPFDDLRALRHRLGRALDRGPISESELEQATVAVTGLLGARDARAWLAARSDPLPAALPPLLAEMAAVERAAGRRGMAAALEDARALVAARAA